VTEYVTAAAPKREKRRFHAGLAARANPVPIRIYYLLFSIDNLTTFFGLSKTCAKVAKIGRIIFCTKNTYQTRRGVTGKNIFFEKNFALY
jgi:hypothetical protein